MYRIIAGAGSVLLLAGCGQSVSVEPVAQNAAAGQGSLRTDLRDATGRTVGTVRITNRSGAARIVVDLAAGSSVTAGFHGLHLHANDDTANGVGCVADATQPANTWFTSADGHYLRDGQTHGSHLGDLPSVSVGPDGAARLELHSHVTVGELSGKAVVLHANRDNFGNIPVGIADEQYQANNGAEAKTAKTGNAGDRIACGVLAS